MQCSCTAIFLFSISLLSSLTCCITGIFALEGTLDLFDTYGPVENRGNPAKDPPPRYWINPETGNFEHINYNDRGNLVPEVFKGIQYFLIALAILMTINCVAFLVVSIRTKKVVNDRAYQGKRNSRSCIGCVGWLSGYIALLCVLWLLMACFAVLPLVEYVITMQRCWDLANPRWSPGTSEKICVDLVQYGLVFFKETSDTGYALMCGPGGNHDPPLGNLEGFCNDYYFNFCLYLVCFITACGTLFGMVLFAMRLVSTFVYLKIRKFENPGLHPMGVVGTASIVQDSHYHENSHNPNMYLPNPNYEQNLLSHYPAEQESLYSESRSADPHTIELKQRYYNEENNDTGHSERRHANRGYSFNSDYPVPAFDESHPPSYHSSNRSHRHRDNQSDRDVDRRRHRERNGRTRRRSPSYDNDASHDSSDHSDYHRSRYHRSRRSRASMSDLDRRRGSTREDRRYRRDSYNASNSSD